MLVDTVAIVPVWKRPKITEACFENLSKAGIGVYCGSSEKWCERLCQEYGFTYIEVSNEFLGRKKNRIVKEALKDDWRQMIEIGTDNLLDLHQLEDYLSEGDHFYGKRSCYITEPASRRAKVFSYDIHRTLGAGRVISREAVERAFPLWPDKRRKKMDTTARIKLKKAGYEEVIISGPPITAGMKSEVNLNHYDDIGGEPVDYSAVAERFPEMKQIA